MTVDVAILFAREVDWRSSFLSNLKPLHKKLTYGELQLEAVHLLFVCLFVHLVCHTNCCLK